MPSHCSIGTILLDNLDYLNNKETMKDGPLGGTRLYSYSFYVFPK